MATKVYPLQVLLLTLSGFLNRHQADVLAYLVEENRVLKEQMRLACMRGSISGQHGVGFDTKHGYLLLGAGSLNSRTRR